MKSELNVFTYGYLPWTCFSNFIDNIKQFFKNIKYAWQRATKGYCDCDIWSLDVYYSNLFYYTLKELARITISYPGRGEFADTEEDKGFDKWVAYLNEMADHFLNTQEWNENISMNKEVMKAFEEMDKYIISSRFEKSSDFEGCSVLKYEYSDEKAYEKARDKWLKVEEKASKFREKEKNTAFKMMSENFFNLWD